MAEAKAKGSIVYELLIVILAVVLVASIVYPKKLADQEAKNTEICRDRMSTILDAELVYLRYNGAYNDTLQRVIEFLRTDPRFYTYVDSALGGNLDSIVTKLGEFREQEERILALIPMATDTVVMDSAASLQFAMKLESRHLASYVEWVHDRMKDLPNMPIERLRDAFTIVDSKKFTLDMDIVRNSLLDGRLTDAEGAAKQVIANIDHVREIFRDVRARLGDYRGAALDSLYNCPTVYRPHKIVHVDTAVIKYLNIYCPIDSSDIEALNRDFLRSKIGGLKIENHGKIENGNKSWETT